MGNCASCLTSKLKSKRRDIVIAVFGLDNSGKTTVIKALKGELLSDVTPTNGFTSVNLRQQKHKFNVTLYDVGGAARIRDIWSTYYPEIYGLIFVLDASALNRLDETKETFMSVLKHPQIQGKPILLLLNKQDKEGALDEVDAEQHMDLARAVHRYQSHCRIETTTATKGTGKQIDTSVKAGYVWLLEQINILFNEIEPRVADDMSAAKLKQKKERQEILERIKQRKEEEEANEEIVNEKEEEEEEEAAATEMNSPPAIVESAPSIPTYQLEAQIPNKPFRNRVLPFQPLPEIREEATSLRSHEDINSASTIRSSRQGEQLVTNESLPRHTERVGLSGKISLTQLPPISPQPIRKLPSLSTDDNKDQLQNGHLDVKRGSIGYEGEIINVKSSDDMSQRSDITHKRKRKHKRLRRFSRPSPSVSPSEEENESARHSNNSRVEILSALPTSEPATKENVRWSLTEMESAF